MSLAIFHPHFSIRILSSAFFNPHFIIRIFLLALQRPELLCYVMLCNRKSGAGNQTFAVHVAEAIWQRAYYSGIAVNRRRPKGPGKRSVSNCRESRGYNVESRGQLKKSMKNKVNNEKGKNKNKTIEYMIKFSFFSKALRDTAKWLPAPYFLGILGGISTVSAVSTVTQT